MKRRKFELSMQCWIAVNHLAFDGDLLALERAGAQGELEDAISRTLTRIEREYRVLARWRRPFRV